MVLFLSFAVAAVILVGRRLAPHLPVSLVAVLGTIWASAAFGFAARGIAVIGPVPGGLPSFGLPNVTWGQSLSLLPVAGSCFVMIIAQSAATSGPPGYLYACTEGPCVDAAAIDWSGGRR